MTSAPSAPQPTHDNNTFVDVEEVVTSAHSTKTLSDTEKETIIDALERNGGRRNVTAKELNISERTLYRKIKEYGIE
jgi:transcriptional regulator with PAS, ATPase and Fis domain